MRHIDAAARTAGLPGLSLAFEETSQIAGVPNDGARPPVRAKVPVFRSQPEGHQIGGLIRGKPVAGLDGRLAGHARPQGENISIILRMPAETCQGL